MRDYITLMSNLAFDTHKFVKDLTRNGMPDKQAEVLADHYASLLSDRLATKEDLFGLRKELDNKIESLRTELKGDNEALRKELKGDNEALRKDMDSAHDKLESKIEALRKDMMFTILSAQLVTILTICTIIGFLLTL